MQTLTRTYPDGTRATYRLEPGSEAAGALPAPLKPYRLKRRADKRLFPAYRPGIDSTADYIRAYFKLNTRSTRGKPRAYGAHLDHMTLYAPLPTAPAAVYAGLDSVETFEPGDRVEGGTGEDYDTGRIERIDGEYAFVAWDSGVKTPAPLCRLTPIQGGAA